MDLNADLGEGEPRARTRAILRQVSSVNIACGGHAGDVASMAFCLREAHALGVRAGAHPGAAGGFGRDELQLSAEALEVLVAGQAGLLERVARREGVRLRHLKLHGALYHLTESDPTLAAVYVATVQRWFPRLTIFARAGGRVEAEARRRSAPVWAELFADRAYLPGGTLAPRSQPGALLATPAEVRGRVAGILAGRGVQAIDGSWVVLPGRTLCIHGDSPDAPKLAAAARSELEAAGVFPRRRPSR